MATPAQCFYCFECLSASFEHREPTDLVHIEELWEQYQNAKDPTGREESSAPPRVEVDEEMEDVLVEEEDNFEDEDEESEDNEETSSSTANNHPPSMLQLPSISRLQGLSPSSSSSGSTPSSLSASSSQSALTNPSSVSSETPKSSSNSSFFSSLSGRRHNKVGATLASQPTASTEETYPLFVTWNTISRHDHKSLRGCIGTFEAQGLSSGLKTYALTSAFDDTRFPPIPSSALPSLSCSLTLLSSFEPCQSALDWDLGTHGLRISFTHRGKRYGATYLPDVAVEQGWSKEECVESLMRKAGWDGSSGGGAISRVLRGARGGGAGKGPYAPWEEVVDFRAIRYKGLKASASYGEWREWKRWVDQVSEKSAER